MGFAARRQKKPKACSEAELVQAALTKGLPFGKGVAVVLREPKMPTGYPDIVAVYASANSTIGTKGPRNLTSRHFQLLFQLHHSGPYKIDEIRGLLLLSKKLLSNLISDLEAAKMVSVRGQFVSAKPLGRTFPARRIIAIEAKLKNWRKALQQAVANLWFASQSYVLLPPMRTLQTIIKEAEKFGVGVLVFDGRKTKRVVEPKQQQIPISYGSWLVSEWALL